MRPRRQSARRNQPGELTLHRRADCGVLAARKIQPVENEAIDVQMDRHRTASAFSGFTAFGGLIALAGRTGSSHLKSASWTGFSILRSSVFAASSTMGIVTLALRFAARNADASATLWMLPPGSASFESRSKSRPSVGVFFGKAF